MNSHFLHQPERASGPRPLPEPGLGIAVINEREGLGDGFYKSPLLRALKRAYPAEKITWVVSEGDSPYRLTMAEIVRPYLARVLVDANLRRPTPGAIRRLRQLPPSSLVIDQRTSSVAVMAAKQMLRTKLYQAASRGYLFCSRRPQGPRPMHKLTQLMALLEAVTKCPVDGSGDIDLPTDAEARAAVLLPDGPRYVGLAPGASTRVRCWPLDRFVSLAKWVQSRGWHPVLLLGPNKQDLREPRRSSRTPSVARHRPAVERGGHHGYGPRSSASCSGYAAGEPLRTHQSQALGPARPASHPCHLLAPLWRARDGAHPADRRLQRG